MDNIIISVALLFYGKQDTFKTAVLPQIVFTAKPRELVLIALQQPPRPSIHACGSVTLDEIC